jgi:hypothetical protein
MVISVYAQHFDYSNANGQQWSLENIPTDMFLYIYSLLHAKFINSFIRFHGTHSNPKTLKPVVTKVEVVSNFQSQWTQMTLIGGCPLSLRLRTNSGNEKGRTNDHQ